MITIDVTQFGTEDTEDWSPAIEAALAALPKAENLFGESRRFSGGVLYFPGNREYFMSRRVSWPAKNIKVIGDGFWTTRIHCADPSGFAFRRVVSAHFFTTHIEGLTFVDCSPMTIPAQSRIRHVFRGVTVKNSPQHMVRLEAIDGVAGSVGGEITDCHALDSRGVFKCEGRAADKWVISNVEATRCWDIEVQTKSSGLRVENLYASQRPVANIDKPIVHVDGDTIFDIKIDKVTFAGDEGIGTSPPRYLMWFGPLDGTTDVAIENVTVRGCTLRGNSGGGANADSAHAVAKFTAPPKHFIFADNEIHHHHGHLIELAHGANNDGVGNIVALSSEAQSVQGDTRHTPVFNRPVSYGELGSWHLRFDGAEEPGYMQLLPDAGQIHSGPPWVGANLSIANDVPSHLGIPNMGFTLTKPGTGTALVSRAIPASSMDGRPLVCSARFRRPVGSEIQTASFYGRNITANRFTAPTSATFTLKPYWVRHWFVFQPDSGDAANISIAVGDAGGSVLGAIEVCDVRVEYGTRPSR